MMRPDEVAPRARNFYKEEDYFSLNVRSGIIRSPVGVRILGIPEELIAGLHIGLEEEAGAAAPTILYTCGKWWGRQFARRHAIEIRQFYQLDAGELPLHFWQQVIRRVWALNGWGKLNFSWKLRSEGFVEVDIDNAMYSDVVGNLGRTTDHVVAGVLASVVGELAGRELECVEVACRSKGDVNCSFLVGLKPRIDVVSAWVRQGRPHSEIRSAIAAGEIA